VTPAPDIVADLRHNLAVHSDLLGWIERESRALRQPDGEPPPGLDAARREALPRLDAAISRLREHRAAWLAMTPEERAAHPEVRPLLRQNQDLVMRLIVLDRENEQLLLRRGLIPARHLPPAARQRPGFVSGLYRRHSRDGTPDHPPG
jgi:hypothetical protein